jgi:O-antigen biosynthesis protein
MQILFDREAYNPAVYGSAREGDVKDVPDDVAQQLIARGIAFEWRPAPVAVARGVIPGSVACIMPTKNRRQFVPRAIACFLAQTHEPRELIILDNGESVADLIPRDTRIRYMRLNGNQTTGQLRNFCCQLATAEFIAHWDDDDWSHPARLAEQVAAIGDQQVVGYRTMLFAGDAGVFRYSGEALFVLGTSLFYRRTWWEKHRFPADMVGEDAAFVSRAASVIRTADGTARMVASTHGANTSPRNFTGQAWSKAGVRDLPKEYVEV